MLGDLNAAEKAILEAREAEVRRDEQRLFIVGHFIAVASIVVRVTVALATSRQRLGGSPT